MPKSKTQQYYDKNPQAKKKKAAYDSAYHSTPSRRKYRSDLNKANRKAGTYGNGDKKDMSHLSNGKLKLESQKTNRARNGSNGKSTKRATKK